jgi:osmoprotectant transport system permease protein
MDWLTGIPAWFADPANWRGDTGVPHLFGQHLALSAASLGLALLIAAPLGLWLGHTGRGGVLAVQASNAGRAVPTLALLAVLLFIPGLGRTTASALIAFTAFGVPPILTNTFVGVREVDRGAVDAARGMGMTGWQVLRKVELPLATPLLMTGVRLAAVQIVATVSIAAVYAFGGLGRIITRATGANGGIDLSEALSGTLLIAALALVVEYGLAWVTRRADPVARAQQRTRRDAGRRGPVPPSGGPPEAEGAVVTRS